ncbi:hypothetical protein ASC89_10530 [Devosia sp. Root413D1]|nr:hypothetical protein ASC89_10530 [Devosia sp. Root413D1]
MVEGGAPRAELILRAPDFIRERAKDMRRVMTPSEKTLWFLLRRKELGLYFRRQHPIGPYILDFYCAAAKLCVEVDGPMHQERTERDQRRTAWLAKEGIRVIRFTVDEIGARPAVVLATIARGAPPSTA